jgi:hypothetical protein
MAFHELAFHLQKPICSIIQAQTPQQLTTLVVSCPRLQSLSKQEELLRMQHKGQQMNPGQNRVEVQK